MWGGDCGFIIVLVCMRWLVSLVCLDYLCFICYWRVVKGGECVEGDGDNDY